MKNIYSNIFTCNKKTLGKTISNLKKGQVIGLPTETVYGLAGNAYLKRSVKRIYEMKKRPAKNPLIVHYLHYKDIEKDVIISKNFYPLYKKFCPGPITFILKKKINSNINDLVLAKLETVAVRFPSHKVTRSILKNLDFPLAMPSANISSGVSPVCAQDVAEEFKKKIKFILDGGKSKIGIESTVIDLTSKPKILRPGIIGKEAINKILKTKIYLNEKNTKISSPGLLKKHYSPGIPIFLNRSRAKKNYALITLGKKYKKSLDSFNLSKKSNLKEAASNLYRILRKIKKLKYRGINVVKIPNIGPGVAINDRLKRASQKK